MLFDLRSRGRRRTVQGVYLVLAVLMGGGLVLFGVGAGNGFGGILDAFTGGGSGNKGQAVSQAEKTALKETQTNPNNPKGWADLVQARWDSAKQGSSTDPNTGAVTFTSAAKKEFQAATQAWQKYAQLNPSPDSTIAILAARSYGYLGDYANQAAAWEAVSRASPTEAKGFECLAAAAYAAKQTRKGDLAAAKALSLIPKADQAQIKQALQAAKTDPKVAQTC